MPKKQNATATATETEQALILLLSDAVKQFNAKQLSDAIVIVIPDTGKAKFNGSHEYVKTKAKDGQPAVMAQSKATFIVAELGSDFQGAPMPYTQANGDTDGLPLSVKLTVLATPPNRAGVTVDEALNRIETDGKDFHKMPPETQSTAAN